MANKLTLQLNSLEAIERLIGGDTEAELQVRESIVQSFANKHLKGLAAKLFEQQAGQLTLSELREFFTTSTLRYGDVARTVLQQKYLESLRNTIKYEINGALDLELRAEMKGFIEEFKVRCNAQLDSAFKNAVQDITKERLEYLIHQKAQQLIEQKLRT